MPKFIDYSGKKIGRVKIIDCLIKSRSRWNCICDCGNEFNCLSKSFVRGETFECEVCRQERKRGIDLIGRKFGRWTVLERKLDKYNSTVWHVKCDCGNHGLVATNALGKRGKSMSCGCLGRKQKSIHSNKTNYPPSHKTATTRIYNIRIRIIHSCYSEKHPLYKNYGEKGFTVCELWRNSAGDFFSWCMQNKWAPSHVVAIKENCNIFSPENCYIISEGEYISNRMVKKITINGITKTCGEWGEQLNLKSITIRNRLLNGYSEKDAVTLKSHANSGKKKWDDEKIKSLYESGLKIFEIANQMKCTTNSISKRLKLMNIKIDSIKRRVYKEKICFICKNNFTPKTANHKKCNICSYKV